MRDDHHARVANPAPSPPFLRPNALDDWRVVLDARVAKEDGERFSWNDHHHVRGLRHPVTFRFCGLRADGTTFAAETDMIPVAVDGRPAAYQFVRELNE